MVESKIIAGYARYNTIINERRGSQCSAGIAANQRTSITWANTHRLPGIELAVNATCHKSNVLEILGEVKSDEERNRLETSSR